MRDRWNKADILSALISWRKQVGSAPRRQDWTGERNGRRTAGQRKWIAEHPRWPSSSCVAAHFGSWSAALAAAGLPHRRLTFDSSIAERVQQAKLLSGEGLGLSEIAAQLGVSRSSVVNYLRDDRCPACHGPLTTPTAQRCRRCTANEPTIPRLWTREQVRQAVVDWTAAHGAPPTYRDWSPSRTQPGRWERESPRWPSASTVCGLYPHWNAALQDASVMLRHRRWSDGAIRAALAGFWAQTGRRPTAADLRSAGWQGPSVETLRRRYGGIAEAWRVLAPVPSGQPGRSG